MHPTPAVFYMIVLFTLSVKVQTMGFENVLENIKSKIVLVEGILAIW